MIKFGRYPDSPDCFFLKYLEPPSHKEVSVHVHISEIRRFFGQRPNETVIYNESQLFHFFTYKSELLGAKGEYPQKVAKNKARLSPTRRVGKPNSPGEGVE